MIHPRYTRCRLSNGGDWEYEARILGLVGPNAKQFCNHCLIKLEQLAKGEAHSLHKLPKYDNTPKNHTLRSVGRCYAKTAQYKATAARVKSTKTADFESCQSAPLIKGTTEKVIDLVSTTPLHLSLGVGLHILNIMEKQAISLDNTIKADMGEYNAFDNLYQQQRAIIEKCKELEDNVALEKEKIRQVDEKASNLRNDRPEFFQTTRTGAFKKNTDLAKGVREQVRKFEREAVELQSKADKVTKQMEKQESQLEKVIKELDTVKGPFKKRFDDVLDNMHLQRVAYHSGSIVGPDVYKITRTKNIKNISKIFKPLQLINKDNIETTYGSHNIVNKMSTLMYKFRACYSLYTANRELCRHEVEILALRCSSFGCWLPTNFPEESLKRKFHVLAVEVPRQARRLQTIGMLTEQTIESLHPYINRLERMFCTTQRKQDKGLLIMKQHNLYSEPCLPTLK